MSLFPSRWDRTREQAAFGGQFAPAWEAAIVRVTPRGWGGGGSSMHWYGEGAQGGESGREIWISAKLRHNGEDRDKETLWYLHAGRDGRRSSVVIICNGAHSS